MPRDVTIGSVKRVGKDVREETSAHHSKSVLRLKQVTTIFFQDTLDADADSTMTQAAMSYTIGYPSVRFHFFAPFCLAVVLLFGIPSSFDAGEMFGMNDESRDYRRRYAFSGFEDAGFYEYAAADANFFQQMRCRSVDRTCSVQAQCCSAFCSNGRCKAMKASRNQSPWRNRNLQALQKNDNTANFEVLEGGVDAILGCQEDNKKPEKMHCKNIDNDSDEKVQGNVTIPRNIARDYGRQALRITVDRRSAESIEMALPNEGDYQLRQALMSALKEYQETKDLFGQCWEPFLERKYIPTQYFLSTDQSQAFAAKKSDYPRREDATGTLKQIFEQNVIYWGTYAHVPPFSYFLDNAKSEFWGVEGELVQHVMRIFNEHYQSEVAFKVLHIPANRGLFNNVADALYNGQVDVFFGKFGLNRNRCSIVSCGCPYYSAGAVAHISGTKLLHGMLPNAGTDWNDPDIILGVLAHDTHLKQVARMFPKVVLRLFWSLWDMAEHLIQGELHGAVTDFSMARFLETIYNVYCDKCTIVNVYQPDDEQIGWAFRQFPLPPLLHNTDENSTQVPLPNVYPIKQHFLGDIVAAE